MGWWIWIVVGLVMLAFEVFVPGGIIMLFFGAAAIVVGTLVGLGIAGPLPVQLALFSGLSVLSLLTLRGPILRRVKAGGQDLEVDTLVGKTVIARQEIAPGAEGKAELRGTSWSAENIGDEPIAQGGKATVERINGLRLFVRGNRS